MTDVVNDPRTWLAEDPDPDTRAELRELLDRDDRAGLADRFDQRLTFGTAGLRGPLGAGPNRMNRAVVRRAAAGLAEYLRGSGTDGPVVIGYDARHKSAEFAADSAAVLAGAGRAAILLPRALPTPLLAFAVRHLGAAAGVMVTASHNPREDNGYKVYLGGPPGDPATGAQIVSPTDGEIESAIAGVGPLTDVPMSEAYAVADESVVTAYVTGAVGAATKPEYRDVRLVYTPLHGVGGSIVRRALAEAGFPAATVVPEQAEPDPDFPTVRFPNPEEPGAMDLAIALGDRVGADLVIANDPDADRCAVACGGRALRGDEVGVLLADAMLRAGVTGTFATTIVSSTMLKAMCAERGHPYAETLTGFKWLARAAPDLAYGYEESLGYAVAPGLVRDKDGITALLVIAELAAELKSRGLTLLDRLDELAREYGLFTTAQVALRMDDQSRIEAAMANLRERPPGELLGEPVLVEDLLPAADVVVLRGSGARVVVRPSGTEPKVKAYFEVTDGVPDGNVEAGRSRAEGRIEELKREILAILRP